MHWQFLAMLCQIRHTPVAPPDHAVPFTHKLPNNNAALKDYGNSFSGLAHYWQSSVFNENKQNRDFIRGE
jgi:hypothetical protein